MVNLPAGRQVGEPDLRRRFTGFEKLFDEKHFLALQAIRRFKILRVQKPLHRRGWGGPYLGLIVNSSMNYRCRVSVGPGSFPNRRESRIVNRESENLICGDTSQDLKSSLI
jgi:hypothetical protein